MGHPQATCQQSGLTTSVMALVGKSIELQREMHVVKMDLTKTCHCASLQNLWVPLGRRGTPTASMNMYLMCALEKSGRFSARGYGHD